MTRSLFLAAALVALATTPAVAQDQTAPKPSKGGQPSLLAPDTLRPEWLLPPPPADDSAQGVAELAEIRRIAGETPAEIKAAAEKDGDTENVTFFADTIPGFDVARLPATRKLFDEVANEDALQVKIFKTYFARRRPYQRDASIATCHVESGSKKPASYPSGHTTLGFSDGIILATLFPDKAQPILARAKLYAEHRMVCGVHYRSDTVAGQALGTAIALKLMDVPSFKADYDAAKAELVRAGLAK